MYLVSNQLAAPTVVLFETGMMCIGDVGVCGNPREMGGLDILSIVLTFTLFQRGFKVWAPRKGEGRGGSNHF